MIWLITYLKQVQHELFFEVLIYTEFSTDLNFL